MDSVTQAVFGAAIGQAAFQNKLGRRALMFGALGGTIPDLDVLWQFGDVFTRWEVHRGFSHSVFFAPIIAPLLGYAAHRWYNSQARKTDDPHLKALGDRKLLTSWMALFALSIFTHPFLDVFTSYGTQLLTPFTDHRFQVNAMPIIDPFYTVPILLAVIFGMMCANPEQRPRASLIATIALAYSVGYQIFSVSEMESTQKVARAQLQNEGFVAETVDAYPTIFQPFYRRIVARTGDHVKIGFYSSLAPSTIQWTDRHGMRTAATDAIAQTRGGRIFTWFARGNVLWYEQKTEAGLIVTGDDLRYGGFDPKAPSFWGIQANIASDGTIGPVYRVSNRNIGEDGFLDQLLAGIFGSDECQRHPISGTAATRNVTADQVSCS